MTNPSDERISALIDGELSKQEHQMTVDELLVCDENRKAWGRYHLIGDTLKRSLPSGMDHGFSSRVMAALDDEPTILAPPPQAKTSWGQRVAGLAVAASVAAVAVLGVQLMYQQDGQLPAPPMAQVPANLSPASSSPQNVARGNIQHSLRTNIQTVTQSSSTASHLSAPIKQMQIHPRLNKYLVDHSQQSPRAAVQGMVPYARIVAYPNSHRFLIQAQK